MESYREFYRRSIDDRDAFWAEQAKLVHWHKPYSRVLDFSRPPFARWFVGGETNLCYNAVDRHLAARAEQKALVYISTERNEEKTFTFEELHREVQRTASMMQSLGVNKGDRVIIYMPMIPEACFAILACARLGAVHSVVFGGFAAASLAARIDDAKPQLLITADGGSRMGKPILYKPLVDEAIRLAEHPPEKVADRTGAGSTRTCRSRRGATSTGRISRPGTRARAFPAPGSSRTSPPTSSTPPAPPASRRECSATSADTRSRSLRR